MSHICDIWPHAAENGFLTADYEALQMFVIGVSDKPMKND